MAQAFVFESATEQPLAQVGTCSPDEPLPHSITSEISHMIDITESHRRLVAWRLMCADHARPFPEDG